MSLDPCPTCHRPFGQPCDREAHARARRPPLRLRLARPIRALPSRALPRERRPTTLQIVQRLGGDTTTALLAEELGITWGSADRRLHRELEKGNLTREWLRSESERPVWLYSITGQH